MEEIINKLRYFNKNFPREALIDAVNMKEEITETLLEELDKIIVSPEIATENQDYMLHIYSIYLLAQFRDKRAFKRIVDLISFAPDDVESLLGDVITERLSSILYSTFDGNLNLLQAIIENPLLNIYARGAALDVYGKLYSDEVVNKEECIDYLRELIYGNYYDINSDIATDIQGVVIEKHIFEMIDDVQFLYDQNRIYTTMFGKYDDFIDFIYSYEYERERVRYIDDIIKEMYWWSCFEQTRDEKRKTRTKMEKLEETIDIEEKLIKHAIEKPKKLGRNDPCPCGSGKKYKKCCLGKEPSVEVEYTKDYSESFEEQKIWLKYYPIEEAKRSDSEIRDSEIGITDIYDKEAIDIDRLVYLALHHRAIPIWIKRDKAKEEMIKISYLIKGYEKFSFKCKEEGISAFGEYDDKYKIHYRSKDWIEKLNNLINENGQEYKYEDVLKNINEIISKFS
jgi:hypothetical protein